MAYLVQTRGPQVGSTIRLARACLLGRNSDCDVVLPLDSVSRHHARIVRDGNAYVVEDLDSRNGTIVNNRVVQGRYRLNDGDVVKLSQVEFAYCETLPPRPASDQSQDNQPHSQSPNGPVADPPIEMHMTAEPSTGDSSVTRSAENRLGVFLELTQSLRHTLSVEHLLPRILQGVFQMLPQAESICIAMEDETGRLLPRAAAHRDGRTSPVRFSRTIGDYAVRRCEAVLSSDAAMDPRFQASESVNQLVIHSVLCAPFLDENERPFGVIQVDSSAKRRAFRRDELELLVGVAAQAAMAIRIAHLHESEVRRRTMQRDLELAAQVQRQFLPVELPDIPGYDFRDHYEPAEFVGGDYYDYLSLADGRMAIVVADVVGHGMPAALGMARLATEVRLLARTEDDPADILGLLNDNLWREGSKGRFATLLFATLDPSTHHVAMACAGHMPPLLRTADGRVEEPGRDGYGPPLSATEQPKYQTIHFTLDPGDCVTAYTDGIVEARDGRGSLYTLERLQDLVGRQAEPELIVRRVVADLRTFLAGRNHEDDVCLVCFGRRQ